MATLTAIHAIPAARFRLLLVDKPKTQLGKNVVNAGFFGIYHEEGEEFTLPAGHLTCDYAAESKWTRNYGEERGRFEGDKFFFDCSTWGYQNQFQGKALSTLVVKDGTARIVESAELPEGEYAISGVPVIRDGKACAWSQATVQGWTASSCRATWHTMAGLKDDAGTVYVFGFKSTTGNLVKSGEAAKVLLELGFRDVIKLDGGGSFYMNVNGEITETTENRRINTVITFEGTEERVFKIALGAGHGAKSAGKRCLKSLDPNETREWWLNDRVCDLVESYLKDYTGYELLRLDDSDDGSEDIALSGRVTAANQWDADFYLSVHHNAGLNPPADGATWSGIVAYSHPKAGKTTQEWRDTLYDALIRHTGLKGNRANPKATSNLQVLRTTKMPAVLLELGFMDSKIDVPVILTDEYAQNCAKAIVEVLAERGNLTKKSSDVRYKVQVGVFSKIENAEMLAEELKAKGYPAYITKFEVQHGD